MSLVSAVSRVQELSEQLGIAAPQPSIPAAGPAPAASSFATTLRGAQGRPATLPDGAEAYRPMIERAARHWGVPAELVTAVIEQESGFDPNATSPAGAQGLMQLMPGTARGLGVTNPYDPAQSIWAGTHNLSTQLRHFGDVRLALAAYNAGSGNVEKYGGIPPFAETQHYVHQVMDRYLQLQGGT
jgi:soluble lytic murein transglycosylase-like protein